VRMLVSKDFPGRQFTPSEVRTLCGLGMKTDLSVYVRGGFKIGRKHVFTYADEPQTNTQDTTATTIADDGDDAGEEEGDDEDDDPPESKPDAVLWLELKQTPSVRRSQQIRNVLIERNMSFVKYHASRIHARLPREVDEQDLVQAGVFGLMDAIKSYDPLRGVQFRTFAALRVTGAINDYLRDTDPVPRLTRKRQHAYTEAVNAHRSSLGYDPTPEEVGEAIGLQPGEVGRYLEAAREGITSSLSKLIDEGRRTTSVAETLPANTPDPLDEVAKRDWWERQVRGMERGLKAVVLLYYRDGMTMNEIGKVMDVSESRVSQMHSTALQIIKSREGLD
jgi:RNA polymerase sigma factor for flagellar operon FliA